jgi:hypothetical protein
MVEATGCKQYSIEVAFSGITYTQYFIQSHQSVQKLVEGSLAPISKFKRPPFGNRRSYGIRKCGVKATFNGITCLPNFINIHQSVQKLSGFCSSNLLTFE